MQERRTRRRRFLALAMTMTLAAVRSTDRAARADGAAPTVAALGFARDVAPVLDRWCVSCHGPREHHGGLRLDGYVWLMRGGDAGPAVEPGDPTASLLMAKIERHDRPAMPPRRRLPAALVARLRAWIAAGAPP